MTSVDDALWSAVGDPTRRQMLDLLLIDGQGTATTLSERLPVAKTGDELERLSIALNHMIERLDAAMPAPGREAELLRRLAIFAPLPLAVIEFLATELQPHEFPAGTVAVRSATTPTPAITPSRVLVTARRWPITRISPSAAAAMIRTASTTVTQATTGIQITPTAWRRSRRT